MGMEQDAEKIRTSQFGTALDFITKREESEARSALAEKTAAAQARAEARENVRLELAIATGNRAEEANIRSAQAERRLEEAAMRQEQAQQFGQKLAVIKEQRAERGEVRAEEAAARDEERLGITQTKEERAAQTEELNSATKRMQTILKQYGEAKGFTWDATTGSFSMGGGSAASFDALVTKARTGDRRATADLKSVARDMYKVRAPKGLMTKDYFTTEAIDAMADGKTITLQDYDGVILKVKKDGNLVRIVEVLG